MNEKINLQELTSLLADKAGISKKEAEAFLREFFGLLTDSLINDQQVKIKDLGTFKLTQVEDRESVNVRTGERVLIPAHQKISFTPSNLFSETVNEPFAIFEPVELSELSTDEKNTPHLQEEETNSINETSVINETEKPDNDVETEVIKEVVYVDEIEDLEDLEDLEETGEVEEKRNGQETHAETIQEEIKSIDTDPEFNVDNSIIPANDSPIIEKITEPAIEERTEIEEEKKNAEEPENIFENGKKRSGCWKTLSIILAILFLLIGGIAAYLWFTNPDFKSCVMETKNSVLTLFDNKKEEKRSHYKPGEVIEDVPDNTTRRKTSEPAVADTTHTDTIKTAANVITQAQTQTKPEIKKEVKTTTNIPAGREKEKVLQSGERLTLIALREYGHKAFWVYIYEENKNIISDPNTIPVGTRLKIPPAGKYNIDKNNPESVNKAKALAQKYL